MNQVWLISTFKDFIVFRSETCRQMIPIECCTFNDKKYWNPELGKAHDTWAGDVK